MEDEDARLERLRGMAFDIAYAITSEKSVISESDIPFTFSPCTC